VVTVHELSLVSDLVEACERASGPRPVALVRVRVASTVPEEMVRQAFSMLTTETLLESAELVIESFDLRVRCACGFDGALGHDDLIGASLAVCPDCGTLQHRSPTAEIELLEVRSTRPPVGVGANGPGGLVHLSGDSRAARP
jgi:Zn finger protein HypA/HybF involved in hydrogenase expression